MAQLLNLGAALGASKTGLSIGYILQNMDGTTQAAHTTTNVVETTVPGTYVVSVPVSVADAGARIGWGTSSTIYWWDVIDAVPSVLLANGAITAAVIATNAIDADAIAADAVAEIQSGLATPTNITAGTITTVTNLTNAPTAGDLTATMKASITTAATAATPTAAAVTGNVGGNVVGSVGSVVAGVGLADGAITAAKIANDAITAAKVAADVTTEIQSGLATAASIAALNNLSAAQVNAEVDTAIADVGLTTTITGRIDAAVSTRATPAQVATELGTYDAPTKAELDAAQTVITNAIDTLVTEEAFGTVSGVILASIADVPTAAEIDTELSSTHGAGSWATATGFATPTNVTTAQTAITNAIGALNDLSAAEVNAEVLDVLNVDTFAEPTSAPAATSSLRAKIGWIFKVMRNRMTQTANVQTLYADDGTTADNTSATSSSGSTFTRGEWS